MKVFGTFEKIESERKEAVEEPRFEVDIKIGEVKINGKDFEFPFTYTVYYGERNKWKARLVFEGKITVKEATEEMVKSIEEMKKGKNVENTLSFLYSLVRYFVEPNSVFITNLVRLPNIVRLIPHRITKKETKGRAS